jgi:uncharacterized membrane protein
MKNGKILYGVLLASLALNFFTLGVVVSHGLFHHYHSPIEHGPGLREMFDTKGARQAIAPQYRLVVDRIWGEFMEGQHDDFDALFALREKGEELLMADTFDPAAFDALQTQAFEASAKARESLGAMIKEIAEQLPPEERKKYFKAGLEGRKKGPRPPPGRE